MRYTLEVMVTVELEGDTAEELKQSHRNIIRRLGHVEGYDLNIISADLDYEDFNQDWIW